MLGSLVVDIYLVSQCGLVYVDWIALSAWSLKTDCANEFNLTDLSLPDAKGGNVVKEQRH